MWQLLQVQRWEVRDLDGDGAGGANIATCMRTDDWSSELADYAGRARRSGTSGNTDFVILENSLFPRLAANLKAATSSGRWGRKDSLPPPSLAARRSHFFPRDRPQEGSQPASESTEACNEAPSLPYTCVRPPTTSIVVLSAEERGLSREEKRGSSARPLRRPTTRERFLRPRLGPDGPHSPP